MTQSIYRITLQIYSRSAAELKEVETALYHELDLFTTETGYVVAGSDEGPTKVTPGCPGYAEAIADLKEQEETWAEEE